MTACDIYCRISEDQRQDGLGVARQQQDCERYATDRGWTIAAVHIDNDLSASRYATKKRPAFTALMERLRNGQASKVVVWDIDRLLRQPRHLEDLIELAEKRPIEIHNINGELNLRTSDGLFVARILAAKAAKESDDASKRIKRKKVQLADKGLPSGGGRRPFGFTEDRVAHHALEAPAVRTAATFVLAGGTLQGACNELAKAGVFPASGKWDPPTLRRILLSPRIAGLRQHQGKVVGDAAWEPIIDRETWLNLRAEMNGRYRFTRPYRNHLLTGIAVCGRCGFALRAQVTTQHSRHSLVQYSCRTDRGGCGKLGVHGAHLEQTTVDKVGAWFTDKRMVANVNEALAGPTDTVDLAALDADRALLDEMAGMVAEGEITLAEWKRARAPIAERVTASEAAEQAARRRHIDAPTTAAELAEVWADLERPALRSVLAVLCKRVEVLPVGREARRFDPERVRPVPAWDD